MFFNDWCYNGNQFIIKPVIQRLRNENTNFFFKKIERKKKRLSEERRFNI